jgi:hypothetical protein
MSRRLRDVPVRFCIAVRALHSSFSMAERHSSTAVKLPRREYMLCFDMEIDGWVEERMDLPDTYCLVPQCGPADGLELPHTRNRSGR